MFSWWLCAKSLSKTDYALMGAIMFYDKQGATLSLSLHYYGSYLLGQQNKTRRRMMIWWAPNMFCASSSYPKMGTTAHQEGCKTNPLLACISLYRFAGLFFSCVCVEEKKGRRDCTWRAFSFWCVYFRLSWRSLNMTTSSSPRLFFVRHCSCQFQQGFWALYTKKRSSRWIWENKAHLWVHIKVGVICVG